MPTDHRQHHRGPRLVDTVRRLMQESGMTARQLAARYEVSRSFVQDILYDKHCPSADICQRIYEDLTGLPLTETK